MITGCLTDYVFYSKEEKFEMYLLQIKGLFDKHVFILKKKEKSFILKNKENVNVLFSLYK